MNYLYTRTRACIHKRRKTRQRNDNTSPIPIFFTHLKAVQISPPPPPSCKMSKKPRPKGSSRTPLQKLNFPVNSLVPGSRVRTVQRSVEETERALGEKESESHSFDNVRPMKIQGSSSGALLLFPAAGTSNASLWAPAK